MQPSAKQATTVKGFRLPRPGWLRIVRETTRYPTDLVEIHSPRDVANALARRFDESEVELFVVVMLNAQNRAISYQEVTRGILNSSLVHPREVFRLSILYGAAGIILAHNHPSGNPTPSADDQAVTRQLVASGKVLDMPVYDHVIVAADRYFSFAESGLLDVVS